MAGICTIYKNIFFAATIMLPDGSPKKVYQPYYLSIEQALERIQTGASREKITEIRQALDKSKQDSLKKNLPCVCFSGKFGQERTDAELTEHSGFIVLDFDEVGDIEAKATEILAQPFIYALWLSPRANGLKALVRIADGTKHREHFAALRDIFPDVDKSGVNPSRVCYESWDPNMWINPQATVFTTVKTVERIEAREVVDDERKVFRNLLTWLSNKGGAFRSGERNNYIFRLAGSCCRFGLHEESALSMIATEYPASNDFTAKEMANTVRSAYKRNASAHGSARFEREILVDKATRREIELDADMIDPNVAPRDVIYGADVKPQAMGLWINGYERVSGIHVREIDELFKSKAGEVTGLTGIGNYGKSTWYKWNKLMRVLLYGEPYVTFSPEDNPPEEFYHGLVEILLGANCTPTMFDGTPNYNRPSLEAYSNAYDFVTRYVFYLYPREAAPTLEYIFERFLEVIIKERVKGCCIDPWNQVAHDYSITGSNVSKYLEHQLGKIDRFAQTNGVYMDLIMHPKSMKKLANGNYECPDVFDLNDGAMWNNKLYNLLVYHRPLRQTDPRNPLFEFHAKKIKRQNVVGKPGVMAGEYIASKRRFEINGVDPMQVIINLNKLDFSKPITDYKPVKVEGYISGFMGQTIFDNPAAGINASKAYASPLPTQELRQASQPQQQYQSAYAMATGEGGFEDFGRPFNSTYEDAPF